MQICIFNTNKSNIIFLTLTQKPHTCHNHKSQYAFDICQMHEIKFKPFYIQWLNSSMLDMIISMFLIIRKFLTSPQKKHQNSQCECHNYDSSQMTRHDFLSYYWPDLLKPPPKPLKYIQIQNNIKHIVQFNRIQTFDNSTIYKVALCWLFM